ncbi:MAG TPA: hypothetical protein VFD73_01025 [Gemmatimonadales bacterium]|nr:hypothetical protein [Gemmatimonadales bacterium]
MLRKVGLLTLLLALTLLATGVAQATPLAGSMRASESNGIVDRFWDWFQSLFRFGGSSSGEIKSLWEGEGSHAHPNGNH